MLWVNSSTNPEDNSSHIANSLDLEADLYGNYYLNEVTGAIRQIDTIEVWYDFLMKFDNQGNAVKIYYGYADGKDKEIIQS